MSRREFRNDVMHDAFAKAELDVNQLDSSLVRTCIRALRRFAPSDFGGWRVDRKEKKRGKRSRKGTVPEVQGEGGGHVGG